MKTTDTAHLGPALIFGVLLGLLLLANGTSPVDTLLAVCAAYVLVSVIEAVFALSEPTLVEPKP